MLGPTHGHECLQLRLVRSVRSQPASNADDDVSTDVGSHGYISFAGATTRIPRMRIERCWHIINGVATPPSSACAGANPSLPQLAVHDPRSGPGQMNEQVHAIDARARIVLDPQVDVFCDTKTEAAILCEILLSEFVFLDFQASLQNVICFLSAHGDMASNLFVAADADRSDRQPCL